MGSRSVGDSAPARSFDDVNLIDPSTGSTARFIGTAANPNITQPAQNTYQLANNQTLSSGGGTTTPVTGVVGGGYILTVQGTFAAGASVQLQFLGPDGATYINAGTAITATNTTQTFTIGNNSTLRLINAGSANVTGLYASLT